MNRKLQMVTANQIFAPRPERENGFALSEAGNSEAFITACGRDVLRDHSRNRWLIWGARGWEPDATGRVYRMVLQTMRERLQAATRIEDTERRARAMRWYVQSESKARIEATLHLAGVVDQAVAIKGDELDSDPWLLQDAAGQVIDLRTGMVRTAQREDRLTLRTSVVYDAAAKCPRYEAFIPEILNNDADTIGFVRRFLGSSLTASTEDHIAPVLLGPGGNGKSSLCELMFDILGDYALAVGFALLESRDRAGIPNDVAQLRGRRLVISSETSDSAKLNAPRFKSLVSGDVQSARFLHGEFFNFRPVAKYLLSTNTMPTISDDSAGLWRRLRVVPFRRTFPIDPTLQSTLRAEMPGILNWLIAACLEWQREGLQVTSTAVAEATAESREDADPLARFIAEAIDVDPDASMPGAALFEHYQQWAMRSLSPGEALKSTRFGTLMGARFSKKRFNGGVTYFGVSRR